MSYELSALGIKHSQYLHTLKNEALADDFARPISFLNVFNNSPDTFLRYLDVTKPSIEALKSLELLLGTVMKLPDADSSKPEPGFLLEASKRLNSHILAKVNEEKIENLTISKLLTAVSTITSPVLLSDDWNRLIESPEMKNFLTSFPTEEKIVQAIALLDKHINTTIKLYEKEMEGGRFSPSFQEFNECQAYLKNIDFFLSALNSHVADNEAGMSSSAKEKLTDWAYDKQSEVRARITSMANLDRDSFQKPTYTSLDTLVSESPQSGTSVSSSTSIPFSSTPDSSQSMTTTPMSTTPRSLDSEPGVPFG